VTARLAEGSPVKLDLSSFSAAQKGVEVDAKHVLVDIFEGQKVSRIEDLYEPNKLQWFVSTAKAVGASLGMCEKPKSKHLHRGESIDEAADRRGVEGSWYVRLATKPFAEGSCRYAYNGQLGNSAVSDTYQRMIIKTFKDSDESIGKREYLEQIEESRIAAYLAQKYNEQKKSDRLPIRFLEAFVAVTRSDKPKIYFVEQPLIGPTGVAKKFTKYCTNAGNWFMEDFDPTLADFALFTHRITRGYLMVMDLQGAKMRTSNGYEFVLTDPVVLCKDLKRFGQTNLGTKCIERCEHATRKLLEVGAADWKRV